MTTISNILDFWFGEDKSVLTDREDLWWKKNAETDTLVKEKFESCLIETAGEGNNKWKKSPAGCLALIILFDQFPRNIYRDNPKAFDQDKKAVSLCIEGLEKRSDIDLPLIQRVFFYMPLEHSEDRRLQRECVRLFELLLREAPNEHKSLFTNYLDYAKRHKEIIDRFGRFPHRNKILGRKSTKEEIEFLKTPNSSFS